MSNEQKSGFKNDIKEDNEKLNMMQYKSKGILLEPLANGE